MKHAIRVSLLLLILLSVPTDLGFGGVVFRDRLDINNDGRPEYVYITSQGTAHFEGLAMYDANLRPLGLATSTDDDWESDNLRWAADRMIIRYEGRHYVIGKTDDYLNYIASITPDNVMKVVCEFGQKRDPSARVVVAKDKAVCDAALADHLDYVPFDRYPVECSATRAATLGDLTRSRHGLFV